MKKFKRHIMPSLQEGLKNSPIILVTGARQTGKTTLVKEVCENVHSHYVTFDDLFAQGAADLDPVGFIQGLQKPVILDEVQRAPEIFLPLKKDVDEFRLPGRYLLTGSANPLVIPKLGDSLAGRMQIISLWPLSQGELRRIPETFIDQLFSEDPLPLLEGKISKEELVDLVIRGGYPALQEVHEEKAHYAWCNSYLMALIQKDMTDLAKIENLRSIPNILQILATRAGGMLSERDVARNVHLPPTTLHRYLQLLQHLFLIFFLPGWYRNLGKRVIKSSKVYFVDTAILSHLLGFNRERLLSHPSVLGKVIENFVITEIMKQLTWNRRVITPYHYRTHDGSEEVDLVLESTSGKVVGVEIKSTDTLSGDDFSSLKALQQEVGKDFHRGIILYGGSKSHQLGSNLYALPITSLWNAYSR